MTGTEAYSVVRWFGRRATCCVKRHAWRFQARTLLGDKPVHYSFVCARCGKQCNVRIDLHAEERTGA